MMDDYEFDDESCPKCGHSPTHARRCHVLGCEDGWIDLHEHEDSMYFDPGDQEMCGECWGTGWERWCPKCGFDLQRPAEPDSNWPDRDTLGVFDELP